MVVVANDNPTNDNKDNVIVFNGLTCLDIPCDRILRESLGYDFETVLVIGLEKDDNELYFAGSTGDRARTLYLLEKAKNIIMGLA